MALFSRGYKRIEPKNIESIEQTNPDVPKTISPGNMPSPIAIAEIAKAVMQNVDQQPTQTQTKVNNIIQEKIKELEQDIELLESSLIGKQEALKILRSI